jgi:hypothetical protein
MSETPVTSDEVIPNPAEALQDALVEFTGCISLAVPDICSYGLTIGESYVPFDPDPDDECNEDDVACSQLWVRVTSVNPDASQGFDGGDCAVVMSVGLEVGVLRCIEVPEGGEAPTATDVLAAALQSMEDMQRIHCAAMGCEVWSSISSGEWIPSGPLGGQYGGIWTFSVEV